ncbi:c-type cytochrome [Tautonia sociabilis]|uniref:C-type cytochrome n=1 Tax=Tautonia sociabilis TaxID=2080755 RepID=A0A432MFN4_9BACT|nr:c-type cytochrome [Tautonia sociabilis]RUL84908.1 c-type cytochrome [Tautonia sociabilis]
MRLPALVPLLAAALSPRPDAPADRPASPLAWPAGPLEVRIAYDAPLVEGDAVAAIGRAIPFRLEDQTGAGALEPAGSLMIAGVSLRDGGRTLVLLTDPHPTEATYSPELPGALGRPSYDLSGVEVSWTPEGSDDPEWVGWLPELDPEASQSATLSSAEHREAFNRMRHPGTLTLRTLLDLPEGEVPLSIAADRPIEAELAFLPLEFDDQHRAETLVESFGEPSELYITLPTGPEAGASPPSLRVSVGEPGGPGRPLDRAQLILPWAPAAIEPPAVPPPLPEGMLGGDPDRGEAVFFGETGKCATCHRIGGKGGEVGPDLSAIGGRLDLAALYHAIEAPSAAISPEYLPYTVAMADGRVFSGIVRAEGPETIRVVGADAQATSIPRAEVAEIRPVSTSIMPVGLAGALGERDLRDLLSYLAGRRDE